ncbi:MAG: hypothetical protein ACI8QC_000281 [Planctomycetota bacterium]
MILVTVIHDMNGEGLWSAEQLLSRYQAYIRRFDIAEPRDLTPATHESGSERWVYPVMKEVIKGIEADDLACAQLGVEFIEEDQGFVFGMILKSNTARALRRFEQLTDEQIERIRRRVAALYVTGVVPKEFAQYLKLIRRLSPGSSWSSIQGATPKNHNAQAAQRYFKSQFDQDGRPRPD